MDHWLLAYLDFTKLSRWTSKGRPPATANISVDFPPFLSFQTYLRTSCTGRRVVVVWPKHLRRPILLCTIEGLGKVKALRHNSVTQPAGSSGRLRYSLPRFHRTLSMNFIETFQSTFPLFFLSFQTICAHRALVGVSLFYCSLPTRNQPQTTAGFFCGRTLEDSLSIAYHYPVVG